MTPLVTLFLAAAIAQEPAYDGTADAEVAEKPETALIAELGGTYASGNAVYFAFNGGLKGHHKWGKNRFGFGGGVNINLSKQDLDGNGTLDDTERANPLEFSSERYFANVRYDRFIGPQNRNALYVSAGFDRDRFAGLLWRFNQQFGYSRVIVDTDATDFGIEVGMAVVEENFATGVDGNGDPINDQVLDNVFPAARLFLGFDHKFNEYVSIGDNVEMFENLITPADFRLYNTFYIAAKISSMFSIKVSHQLAFDNEPVPGFQKLDQITQLTLVANIF